MGNKGGVYDTYHDENEKGLILIVSNGGAKTFYLYRKINGRPERVKLGAFPDLSVDNARKQAQIYKGKIATGSNPNTDRKNLRQEITLKELFEAYMERYSKKQKKSWIYDQREITKFLSHWFTRKISAISKSDIQKLHEKIHDENGLYQANRILERLRSMYNKAIEWEWQGTNPTQGIKKFKEKTRDRFILPAELPLLYQSLYVEENETIRDYVWISLFTGARKGNVLAMRWEDIDWISRQWRIPETKNGEPVTIPLIQEALSILERRQAEQVKDKEIQTNPWVFPGEGKKGYLADPKRAWYRILARAGIKDLRIHDIRRTMGSYQAITGASLQIIGKSLGHKSQHATQIYSRLNLDPVRASMEKAASLMLTQENK